MIYILCVVYFISTASIALYKYNVVLVIAVFVILCKFLTKSKLGK